jgi:multiple sugar transport system substrate-binding protein
VRGINSGVRKILLAWVATLIVLLVAWRVTTKRVDGVTLSIWSHEADEPAKVALREKVARAIEREHPGVHVEITWYDLAGLSLALKTALPAGQGPDVFYIQPNWTDLITDGYLVPLDGLIDWSRIYDWARQVWVRDGKTWAVPQEMYTDELYYNKNLLAKLGYSLPANAQFTQAQFLDLVRRSRLSGVTPIAQGVGDRNFPGAYIVTQALLRALGPGDYSKLFAGVLSFADARVVGVLAWFKQLVDAGGYPMNFMTLKLAESHYYFYAKPGALLLPMGSWYVGRAFVPADDGGQPADFPLGIMQFPAMDHGACNECKTRAIGSSFAINAASQHKDLAADYLNAMSAPEIGQLWIQTVHLQTAVKTETRAVTGPYAAYFQELMERQTGAQYFTSDPTDFLEGRCLDTFAQVLNSSFPGGLLSVDETIRLMNRGCYSGHGG